MLPPSAAPPPIQAAAETPASLPSSSSSSPRAPLARTKVTEFQIEGGVLKLPSPIVFETNSDKLSPVSDEPLAYVHDYLDAKPVITLMRIEGHTDDDGGLKASQALSEKRALSVARWLVAAGVKCDRVLPVGFGQEKPLVPNDSPDHRAQNRRVVFVNAALKGRSIGGMAVDGGGKIAGDACH